jgi:hypothetical protein
VYAFHRRTRAGQGQPLPRAQQRALNVRILDDGALRFLRSNGEAVDRALPGCSQPAGDAARLPTGRGQRLYLGLAVDVMIQQSRKGVDVPAGTS